MRSFAIALAAVLLAGSMAGLTLREWLWRVHGG